MKLTETEWQLMNALWKKHPATAREIMEEIPGEVKWAYTTIKTMLARLIKKNAITEYKRGNMSFYEPAIEQNKTRYNAVKSLFNKVLEGTMEPVISFISKEQKLSENDRQKLLKLLKEKESENK